MKTIHQTIFINAPREKVWSTMLEDATYREWTKPFHEGSYFKGDWSEGSKMLFLGPDADSNSEMGMVSTIRESRPMEFISIEHLGFIKDGVEDMESEEVKKWAGALENYTFVEKDGGTELIVDTDVNDEEKEFMEAAWIKSLQVLKEIAERN